MKNNATKRTLFASILSLVLCLSMLVGSTFAWFTDTASTGVNTITAGNLDLKLEVTTDNGTTWTEVNKDTLLFDENALWEPGHTEVAYLRISNVGTLAFKYQFNINVANETIGYTESNEPIKLSEFLKYGTVEGKAFASFATREAAVAVATNNLASYTKLGELENQSGFDYVAIAVTMPTTVGNEANHKTGTIAPSIELGVNVFATQMPSETDSFGDDYDKDAFGDPIVFNADATYTVSAIKANGSNGVLQSTAGTLTINGSGTVTAVEADDGYAMTVWANGGDVVIEGGNFTQTITGSDETYDLIYASNGGNITIKGGTFQSATPAWTLNVKDADRATSHITVMGGKFYKFDPSNANTGAGEITVHEDYKVVQDGDWYEVVKK